MSLVSYQYERENKRAQFIVPDLSFETFVAKVQKAKTRKDKDYFVLRATVPKDVAKKIDIKPGDYLFFKVKKAEWYHMLDWEKMKITWQMLPEEIKYQAILEGLPYPGTTNQTSIRSARELGEPLEALGATSPISPVQMQKIETYKPT